MELFKNSLITITYSKKTINPVYIHKWTTLDKSLDYLHWWCIYILKGIDCCLSNVLRQILYVYDGGFKSIFIHGQPGSLVFGWVCISLFIVFYVLFVNLLFFRRFALCFVIVFIVFSFTSTIEFCTSFFNLFFFKSDFS